MLCVIVSDVGVKVTYLTMMLEASGEGEEIIMVIVHLVWGHCLDDFTDEALLQMHIYHRCGVVGSHYMTQGSK